MMPENLSSGTKVWQLRSRNKQLLSWFIWLIGTALFMYCWQRVSESTTWFFVWDAPRIAGDIGSRMMPPRWSYINELWKPLWDTINIATIGTMLAIVMAIPVAFLAARNTTPSSKFVRPIALLIIVSSRSINSLIWSLLLVSIIGPGVLAGIVAISFRSIGFISKLLYEAIEEIDKNQVEAISATGANSFANPRLWNCSANTSSLCGNQCVPLGHQHPRIHSSRPCWCRWNRLAIERFPKCSCLASSHTDPHTHTTGSHLQ